MTTKTMTHITPHNVHATLQKHMLADGFDLVCDLHKSHGTWLHDAKSGRDLLDMFTCFASLPLGYNHPDLTDPKFLARMAGASVNKLANSDLYSVEMAEAVELFGRHAIPKHLPHLFFVEGGTLGVENALKVAFDWKVRKNFAKGCTREKGHQVIHFRHAFHGRSGYTLSLTNTADPRKYQYFPRFDWPRIDPPALTFSGGKPDDAAAKKLEERAIAQIAAAIAADPDDIACLIIEPIQAEGGENHFRPEFHRALRDLCTRHEIMLIYDEVQTGMGMTGEWWAHQHYGIEPDAISFGKKAQVCGVLAGPRVDEVERNVFVEPSRINSTWGGNLVDIIRLGKIVEVIVRDRLLHNAREVGAHLLAQLLELEREIDEVSNVRGLGLMCAVDFPDGHERDRVRLACFNHGMMILPCGTRSLRFRPPLNVSRAEIDQALDILRTAIKGHSRKATPYDAHP